MIEKVATETCVICGAKGDMTIDPPRRTLARGVDPSDSSFSVTIVLPDVRLCADHYREVGSKAVVVGWCDEEQCRIYGAVGTDSPCGKPFTALKR
jgi:hypothetical protein